MKKSRPVSPVFLIALLFIPFTLFSQVKSDEEIRSVFLHNSMFSGDKKEAKIMLEDLLDKYKTIGINNIACYYDLSDKQRDFDFLGMMLETAHKRNIKVHPIFLPGYRVNMEGKIEEHRAQDRDLPWFTTGELEEDIREHPEWLIRGKKGEIYPNLNLANPEARNHILRKISGILQKYDVDGIRLDYVRFQVNQGFSYDKATCEAFKSEYGKSPLEINQDAGSIIWCKWIEWNAEQVTTLVKDVKALIVKSGKNIPLSVDVFPGRESAKIEIAQDWGRWAREGIVDVICPMIYTNNLEVFRETVIDAVATANGQCLVCPSIGVKTSHNKNTPEGLVQSVRIMREEGVDGIYFFSGYALSDEFMDELKATVFK
ncbi:MAG: family 10 glycosylhydrolase [Bacteroidales bacterium]|nr:family 10 glycosylhydrolase [Bacteroidales bacterium]